MTTIGPDRTSERRRALVPVVAVVGLVAVLAVVLFAVTRPAKVWDPATPQGVVQTYVTAVLAGDTVAAADLLAPGSPCAATDLDRTFLDRDTRVDLVGSTVQGTQAQVRVRVGVDPGADPLGDNGEERTFRLTRTTSGWRIDGIPWPLYECTGRLT
ncbi:hypothetical protein [Kineosporia sp. A_224]|uniref:hypothetical protein n=1 Tax=Kineosporia sp. A_224 TaxID=1962180 RepID=UPI000B4ACED7|nr:hypothetical protein [Kineosporia sp. A_224]